MQLPRLKMNIINLDYFFIDLIQTQLIFIEFRKLANAVSGNKILQFYFKKHHNMIET